MVADPSETADGGRTFSVAIRASASMVPAMKIDRLTSNRKSGLPQNSIDGGIRKSGTAQRHRRQG
jgi:hypothetical protein